MTFVGAVFKRFNILRLMVLLIVWPGAMVADPAADLSAAANASFAQMPAVRRVGQIAGHCGADETVATDVAYCTSQNVIFVSHDAGTQPGTVYLIAHAFGHAVQVRHGIADVALAKITARRNEEAKLRRMVETQVDCIAGFLLARADMPASSLFDMLSRPSLNQSHWGRDPLRIGPRVMVNLQARDRWFQIGQTGDLSACSPGEFTADLLISALRQ